MSDNKEQYYEIFISERKALLDAKLQIAQAFDKAVLTLSGGALGLSFTFIKQVVPDIKPETLWLLKVSWGSYCLSILLILIAMIVSQNACNDQIKLSQEYLLNNGEWKKSILSTVTMHLNFFSIGFFIIGTGCLAYFGIVNLT